MENNKELFAKAKAAETPEALLTLAKENGMEMTEESAAAYFDWIRRNGFTVGPPISRASPSTISPPSSGSP